MGYILIADRTGKDCDSIAKIISDFFEARDMRAVIRTITKESQLEEALSGKAPDIAVIRLGDEPYPEGEASEQDSLPDGKHDGHREVADAALSSVKRLLTSSEPGRRIAARIRDMRLSTALIFISDGNGYAEETYSLQTLGYLRRPVREEKFIDVLRLAVQVAESRNSIVVNSDREKTKIYVSDIIYIETMMRKLIFHTRHGDVIGCGTLGGILKQFPKGEFLKVSRFEAVSADWVAYISKNRLTLKNGATINISSRMLGSFMDQYETWRETTSEVKRRQEPVREATGSGAPMLAT